MTTEHGIIYDDKKQDKETEIKKLLVQAANLIESAIKMGPEKRDALNHLQECACKIEAAEKE